MQLIGCFIGMVAIFLPSALLVLFFFPIWNNLKKYAAVYRSLEGINAAVVGIMIASTFYIMKDISLIEAKTISALNVGVILGTFLLLCYTRMPSPVIVAACLVAWDIFFNQTVIYSNCLFLFLLLLFRNHIPDRFSVFDKLTDLCSRNLQ